jgi:plasmid stabilization system protein ParE
VPRRVIPTELASEDLANAKRWLMQPGSGEAAKAKLQHIRTAIRQLGRAPCRWAEGDHPGVREIPVEGYTILYEVGPDTGDNATAGDVTILRVFGPGMDRSRFGS